MIFSVKVGDEAKAEYDAVDAWIALASYLEAEDTIHVWHQPKQNSIYGTLTRNNIRHRVAVTPIKF